MNKKEQKYILDKLSVVIGKKLNQVSRAGTMIQLGLGELKKSKKAYKTETGEFAIREDMVSRYAIHIDCVFRITCGNTILISRSDIFKPNSELINSHDFDEDKFEWDINGVNRFDEMIRLHFEENPLDFYVNKIVINQYGDLKINLSNNFCIEIFVDVTDAEECWRYFESGNIDDTHLVITGVGFNEE